jgi:hypothetical protein
MVVYDATQEAMGDIEIAAQDPYAVYAYDEPVDNNYRGAGHTVAGAEPVPASSSIAGQPHDRLGTMGAALPRFFTAHDLLPFVKKHSGLELCAVSTVTSALEALIVEGRVYAAEPAVPVSTLPRFGVVSVSRLIMPSILAIMRATGSSNTAPTTYTDTAGVREWTSRALHEQLVKLPHLEHVTEATVKLALKRLMKESSAILQTGLYSYALDDTDD